jgi:hypothetical protein
MSTTFKIVYHTDPGHGWLEVNRKLLKEFDVEDKITSFSYQKGNTVYLEEDCDAATLVTAMAIKGHVIEYVNKHTNDTSPIRDLDCYTV